MLTLIQLINSHHGVQGHQMQGGQGHGHVSTGGVLMQNLISSVNY